MSFHSGSLQLQGVKLRALLRKQESWLVSGKKEITQFDGRWRYVDGRATAFVLFPCWYARKVWNPNKFAWFCWNFPQRGVHTLATDDHKL